MSNNLREVKNHGTSAFPFALYRMTPMTQPYGCSLHWHEETELIFVQQGILDVKIEQRSYRCHPGDIFVVNSREIHEMSVVQAPATYATILFPLSSLLFQQEDDIRENYLRPLVEGELHFANDTRKLTCLPTLREKLERMIDLYNRQERCYMLKIRTLLLEILCDFFSEEGALVPVKSSRAREKQREILAYLYDNFRKELTLDTVAEEFNMVPKYFSRYFKQTFCVSLTEYIANLRLEKAADLLRQTNASVADIAIQTGFNSCSYFNKQFRKAYQITPSQYRKQSTNLMVNG